MTKNEQMNNYPEVEKMLEQYEAAWKVIWRANYDSPEYEEANKEEQRLYKEAQKLGWTLKCRNCRTYYASKMSEKRIANL